MDRRLAFSAVAAALALAAGVVGVVTGVAVWALVAGVIGFCVGVGAAALGARTRDAEEQLVRTTDELHQVRRDLDTLTTVMAEEDNRLANASIEPAAGESAGELVFDNVSGLLDEKFFAVSVQQRVAAARRQLQPVSIVLFELDGLSNLEEETKDHAMGVLGEVLRKTLRECDSACRIGDVMAAAVLEDTTEAGAVWAAERVRGTLHSSSVASSLTVSAGVACYPSHALAAPELVAMAVKALELARQRGRDQVEIAPSET